MLDLSVIIPTHNRVDHLPGLLASLASQDYPAEKWEVIIVDDGSSDSTRSYLDSVLESSGGPRPANMRVIHQAQSGVAKARNNGGRSAHGRGLLFLDDDMLASPTLVGEHARVHLEDSQAVVIGYISVPTMGRRPWVAWEDHHMQRHYDALKSGRRTPGPRDFYTGNVSVSAALFNTVNGFDASLPRAEDLEMGYRLRNAGARFYHRIAAGSLHLGQHSFEGWARNAGLYGQADVMLAWEKGHIELQKEIFNWYHARRRSGRAMVEVFSAHPGWLKPVVGLLNLAGRVAYYPGLHSISRACYSTIHHLNYWLAIIQALGPERFWKGVEVESIRTGVGYDAL